MFLNILIIIIFIILVVLVTLPFFYSFESLIVIFFKLLYTLNMQIVASNSCWLFSKISNFVFKPFGIKISVDVTLPVIDLHCNEADEINVIDILNETDNINPEDFNELVEKIFDYFYSYNWWIFFPICLYLFIIYFLHSIFGLYSAYVDYFQKNPDHFESMRGFLPALFFFLFLFFIVVVINLFFLMLYLHHILWFLFI